ELPEQVGLGGDVSDFLVRLGRTVADFQVLLTRAQPLPESRRSGVTDVAQEPLKESNHRTADPRVNYLKAHVPIETIARTYVQHLRQSGRTLVGQCIFHTDTQPSLVLYPAENRFHCYGCGTHGDVIDFLMEAECWSFSKALQALEKYLQSVEP
ncbi:MAG TPA: CHC2 zinc finger domain-containing protein, partial [Planctomycetaceae bacterium]|nr:CHC2 zinc finger domain-containing protein [Planctomycetaceae bacterium]